MQLKMFQKLQELVLCEHTRMRDQWWRQRWWRQRRWLCEIKISETKQQRSWIFCEVMTMTIPAHTYICEVMTIPAYGYNVFSLR